MVGGGSSRDGGRDRLRGVGVEVINGVLELQRRGE